jgi:hypothetical protein
LVIIFGLPLGIFTFPLELIGFIGFEGFIGFFAGFIGFFAGFIGFFGLVALASISEEVDSTAVER